MGEKAFDALALVLVPAGLLKAAAGTVAFFLAWYAVADVNYAGVPRWIPHGLALVLAWCAFECWRAPRAACLVLASVWAIAGGAFARPALIAAGWWCPPIEWALVPALAVAALLALRRGVHVEVRIALLGALAAAAAVGIAIAAPRTAGAAATTYGITFAAGLLSAGVARRLRRTP